jgi:ferric-dicitrate binding protein FerR (iron transport regulator)
VENPHRESDSTERALLMTGDVARLTSSGPVTVTHEALGADGYFAWTTGHLVFRNTPLVEALVELSRWYDADLRLATDAPAAAAQYPLTASVDRESQSEVVQLLSATLDARVERQIVNGRTVLTLHPNSATPQGQSK